MIKDCGAAIVMDAAAPCSIDCKRWLMHINGSDFKERVGVIIDVDSDAPLDRSDIGRKLQCLEVRRNELEVDGE